VTSSSPVGILKPGVCCGQPAPTMVQELAADAFLCVMYIGLNAGLNFSNRWALGVHGFAFPMTLTAAHMLLNPMFLSPLMMLSTGYRAEHMRIISKQWRPLSVIAVLNAIQICLNNSSLVYIELSMNQVVRATVPVFVAFFQRVLAKPPPLDQLAALVCISLGVILVVFQPVGAGTHFWGILLVTSSVTLQAAQMVFAGNLLSEKLDSFQMTFYTSPVAFLTLVIPCAAVEGSAFTQYASHKYGTTIGVLFCTCAMAVFYNVILFQTIKRLSPAGSAVLGNVKVVVLLIMSSVLMGEMTNWTLRQYMGCVVTFVAAAVYSALKLLGQRPKTA